MYLFTFLTASQLFWNCTCPPQVGDVQVHLVPQVQQTTPVNIKKPTKKMHTSSHTYKKTYKYEIVNSVNWKMAGTLQNSVTHCIVWFCCLTKQAVSGTNAGHVYVMLQRRHLHLLISCLVLVCFITKWHFKGNLNTNYSQSRKLYSSSWCSKTSICFVGQKQLLWLTREMKLSEHKSTHACTAYIVVRSIYTWTRT